MPRFLKRSGSSSVSPKGEPNGYTRLLRGGEEVQASSGRSDRGSEEAQVQAVQTWLCSSRENEVLEALRALGGQRPHLVRTVTVELASERARQQQQVSQKKKKPAVTPPQEERGAEEQTPIVQFAAPLFIGTEDDGEVEVQLLRLGAAGRKSVVHFTTRDSTAKAGREYVATQGSVVFSPGESTQTLSVPVISVPGWNPTNDFLVELLEENAENAMIVKYHTKTRVKVVNNDCFPTQTHEEHIMKAINQSPPNMEGYLTPFWAMMMEYSKWNFNDSNVRKRTIRKLFYGMVHNADFFVTLYLNVYLIDFVLNTKKEEDELLVPNRLVNLVLLSVFKLLFMTLLHICDYMYAGQGIAGSSQVLLHAALVERYLNYDESTRKEIHPAEISMGMMSDIPALVNGYVNIIEGIQVVGRLAAMLCYQFSAPLVLGRHFMWESMSLTFSFPILAGVFLWCRDDITAETLDEANRKFHHLATQVQETVRCYRLIADFRKRSDFVSRLRSTSQESMRAKTQAEMVILNNIYYARWVGGLAVAFYTLFGGIKVQHGLLPLGMFLNNISIFQAYADVWAGIYTVLLNIQNTFPALEHVMVLLNMPIDLNHRRQLDQQNLQATKLALEGQQDTMQAASSMPLVFENIVVRYSKCGMERVVPINLSGRMVIQQGTMVCIAGPYGEGKSTLLRIAGGAALPDPKVGMCHVPAYLRVLNVAADPIFFKGTLMENLTIDIQTASDGSMARVMDILRQLMLITPTKKNVERLLESDTVAEWAEEFSEAERNLLNMARALTSNCSILCIHKPMRVGMESVELVKGVLQAFRDFVDMRGLGLDPKTRHLRQPRTCIITSNKQEAIDSADEVYMVSRKEGIQCLEKDGTAIEQVLRMASSSE